VYAASVESTSSNFSNFSNFRSVQASSTSSSSVNSGVPHRTYDAAVTSGNGVTSTRGRRSANNTAAVTDDGYARSGSVASTNSRSSSVASSTSNIRGEFSLFVVDRLPRPSVSYSAAL